MTCTINQYRECVYTAPSSEIGAHESYPFMFSPRYLVQIYLIASNATKAYSGLSDEPLVAFHEVSSACHKPLDVCHSQLDVESYEASLGQIDALGEHVSYR